MRMTRNMRTSVRRILKANLVFSCKESSLHLVNWSGRTPFLLILWGTVKCAIFTASCFNYKNRTLKFRMIKTTDKLTGYPKYSRPCKVRGFLSLSFEVFISTNARCVSASMIDFMDFWILLAEGYCVALYGMMYGMDVLPYLADIKFLFILINEAVDQLRSIAQFNVWISALLDIIGVSQLSEWTAERIRAVKIVDVAEVGTEI